MNRKYFIALLFLCVITAGPAPAVSLAETLSLDQSIDTALKENPQMKIAHQKLLAASAREREQFAGYLPYVTGNASYLQRNFTPVPPLLVPIITANPLFRFSIADEVYDVKFSVTQPLYTFGRISGLYRQSSLQRGAAEEEYRKTKNDTVYKVKEGFYKYLLARESASIAQDSYDVAKRHLVSAEGFYKRGKVSSYEVSRAKVALANAKTNLIRSQNSVQLAQQALMNILNRKEDNIEFSGDLSYTPSTVDSAAAMHDALANRPELKQSALQEGISHAGVKIAASGNKPNITLGGSTEWENTELPGAWYNAWSVIAAVNIPLFDGFSTIERKQQAQAALEQAHIAKSALEETVKLEVRTAYLNYGQAKEAIEANRENVATAKENLVIAQKRYDLGLMTDIEVRDAELALNQAQMNYVQALYDYNSALASLERAIGK